MLALSAAVVVTLAVAAGATLAWLHLRRARVPFAAGLAHAATATAGLVLLAAAVWAESQPIAVNSALLCLALSLVGGIFVLLFRLQGDAPPGFMVALHGAMGVLAAVLLWVGIG